uniref:Uncharacterized protein n=1 Tax=Arundo donax TaxID=35708 RepID=A0A0A8YUD9_ARUDO
MHHLLFSISFPNSPNNELMGHKRGIRHPMLYRFLGRSQSFVVIICSWCYQQFIDLVFGAKN